MERTGIMGRDAISLKTCQNWVRRFSEGEFDISDSPKTGRPSDNHLDEAIEQELVESKHATSRELSQNLGVSAMTICRHLKAMGKKYLKFKLSTENCNNRVLICNQLRERYLVNNFLNQLITVDKVWLLDVPL